MQPLFRSLRLVRLVAVCSRLILGHQPVASEVFTVVQCGNDAACDCTTPVPIALMVREAHGFCTLSEVLSDELAIFWTLICPFFSYLLDIVRF